MIVKVTDQNEQPPYFKNTPYKTDIVENKEYANSVIYKVMGVQTNFIYTRGSVGSELFFPVDM